MQVIEHAPLPETDLAKRSYIATPAVKAWFIDGNGIAEVEVAPRAPERRQPEQPYQPYYLIGAVYIAPCVGSNALWVEQTWGPRASSGQWMSIEPHHGIARIDGAGWVS